jgi:DNA-directed RNA polymerase subunit RPC12/RpoP
MKCPSQECGRPFHVNQYELPNASIARGKIRCPHCGLVMVGSSELIFLTHALTPIEEDRFKQNGSANTFDKDKP